MVNHTMEYTPMANHTMKYMKTLCAAALGLALAHPAVAEDGYATVGSIKYSYTVNADGASVTLHGIVTNNNDLPETLIVPETLDGKPVTKIEQNAFKFTPIVSLTLPASLTAVDAFGFFGATKLREIKVASANTHFVSKDGVLFKNDESGLRLVAYPSAREGASYAIPEGTTRMDSFAFYTCQHLVRLTIPASVAVDGFGRCEFIVDCPKLARVEVAEGNVRFHSEDGVLFLDTRRPALQSDLLVYPAARAATDYTVPDHVNAVRTSAFAKCENLEKVTFPASVTELQNNVFDGCTNLKALYFNGAPPDLKQSTQAFENTPANLKVYYTDATYKAAWEGVYSDGGAWAYKEVKSRPPVSFWNADGLPRDGETSYATGTRTVAVPNAWLLDNNVLGLTEDSTAADATDALAETGANGIPRWKSYLFGFEPDSDTPAAAQLKVWIDGFDAERRPIISWTPDQRTNEAVKDCVKYTIRAAMTLDKERPWSDYDKALWKKNFRFFYVEVEVQ